MSTYIKQLILENFQSHEKSVLELDPHLNVLVGVSNIGKSSVSRALSCLLFNQWDKSWVRSGSKYARISVTTDTGVEVIREKGEKVNRYLLTVPGGQQQTFEAFGVHVPEPVQQALKIGEVVVGKEDILNLNLSTQLSPLFMLSNTGAQNARIMGTLSGGHYLDWAIREINRDKNQISKEITLMRVEIDDLGKQVEKLKAVEDFITPIGVISTKLESVQALEAQLQALQSLFGRIKSLKAAWTRETAKEALLEQVNTDDLVKDLNIKVDNHKKGSLLLGKITEFKAVYEKKNKLNDLLEKVNIAAIPDRSQIDTLNQLRKISGQLTIAIKATSNLNTQLSNTEKEHKESIQQYSDLLATQPACPTCGQTICQEAKL